MSSYKHLEETSPLLLQSSAKRVSLNIPDEAPAVSSQKAQELPPLKPGESYTFGIVVMLFITFLSSICFSIVLPSIWPFLKNEMHSKQSVVGWAVAVNSAGSFLASPLFGMWADRRSTREVVGITLIVMIIGNVMYSLSQNIWMLLAARFIVGVAAGNYAVAQTYLSYATTPSNRTMVMAFNSAATVLGFIIGPAFALIAVFIRFDIKEIKVNEYTSPGYISAVLSLVGLVSLVTLKEISPQRKRAAPPKQTGSVTYGSGFYSGQGSVKDLSKIFTTPKASVPFLPISICLFAYFTYTCSFTVFETIGTDYTYNDFGWTVRDNCLLYVALGGVCVIALVILQLFIRFTNDRALLAGTTALAVIGFGILVDVKTEYVPFWRFCLALTFSSASYSTSVAVLISIYSKVLEGLDQGLFMGWLSSSGSIARIVGPVLASYVMEYGGPRNVFILMVGMMFITFLVCAASYKVLIPRDNFRINTTKSVNNA